MRPLLIFLLLLLLSWPAKAEDQAVMQMQEFAAIPVLHEGRIKPLASFAAAELERISESAAASRPVPWLAEALFNPQYAAQRPVFKVTNPEVRALFKLPARPGHLYSLEELGSGLSETHEQALQLVQAKDKNLSPEQEALVALHEKALTFAQIIQAMTPLLPLDVNIPSGLGIKMRSYEDQPTWLEVRSQEPVMLGRLDALLAAKGGDLERYSDDEKALATLAFAYQQINQTAPGNQLVRAFPAQGKSGEWRSLWAMLSEGQGDPQNAKLLAIWQDMARAYRNADNKAWLAATAAAKNMTLAQSGNPDLAVRLQTELLYNMLAPFKLAVIFYGLALLCGALFIYRPARALYFVAGLSLFAAIGANATGILMRVMILGRPPVGSLYESLLFVSLIIAVVALLLELKRRDAFVLTGAGAASLLILLIAPAIAPEGDDLQMLVAVLNTNFWLGTHVICITAGYGLSILTAVLAHIWLLRSGSAHVQDGLSRNIYVLSLVALLLTAVGTVLGGIWADQSWGRFWGWDPKENGALLIVLWLVWLHHGRLGNHLAMPGFQAGLAALNIVVALAWFGVNLLSVGLHSYGFISGIAAGLAAFCISEIVIITALYLRAKRQRKLTA